MLSFLWYVKIIEIIEMSLLKGWDSGGQVITFQWGILRATAWWNLSYSSLTHWGRVTHICITKLTIIGSDNGLSPGLRQAIIWTNAGILLIRPLGTNFNEMLIEILAFSFMKMRFKVSSAKWRPFCLGLNVLRQVSWSWIVLWQFCSFHSSEAAETLIIGCNISQ